MSMHDAIKNFSQQFLFEPEVKNEDKLSIYNWYIVAGMGGSHLAADLLKVQNPKLPIIIHQNYGLPNVPDEILQKSLLIASSYSGNTEEAIDAYKKAKENNIPVAVVTVGGELLKMAQTDGVPYIQLPNTGIQPRSALGFSLKALLALMGKREILPQVNSLAQTMMPESLEEGGKNLAKKIQNHIPVIYTSEKNGLVGYNWKIKFNETGKIPAFCNVLPELNHNEMTGFDFNKKTRKLSENFCFILLYDESDHPKIKKRMDVTKKLLEERKLLVISVELSGENAFHKIFSSLVLADWTAYHTAMLYKVDPENVPMVEEFKKLIS